MDALLEFLNRWVARPVAILGAFITIVVTVQSIAVGDLQRIVSLFGLPEIEVSVPPILTIMWERAPSWLTDLWQYDLVKIAAFIFVVISSTAACALWCVLLGRLGWFGFILIAPALIGSIWAPIHLFMEWFPDVLSVHRVSYEVAQGGAFSRAVFTGNGAAMTVAFIVAAISLLITTSIYFNRAEHPSVTVYFFMGAIVGSALIVAAFQDARADAPEHALRVCAAATVSQIDAHQAEMRAFVDQERPPATPNKGMFANGNTFQHPWYVVRHGCTIAHSDAGGHHFRLAISHATKGENNVWRCDVGYVSGVRGLDAVRFEEYELITSFRGRDCQEYRNGNAGASVRKYMTPERIARLYER